MAVGRPPWGIVAACVADGATGLAALYAGGYAIVMAIAGAVVVHAQVIGFLEAMLAGLGLLLLAVGVALGWTSWSLWRGAAWARWPSLLVATGLVPAAVLLTAWAGQGGILIVVVAGPAVAIGLFLPAARRHVGTAPAVAAVAG